MGAGSAGFAGFSIRFFPHYRMLTPSSLTLGLDNLDRIFEYPEIAPDCLAMLRSWHEEGNSLSHWEKFRLASANSTEIYI